MIVELLVSAPWYYSNGWLGVKHQITYLCQKVWVIDNLLVSKTAQIHVGWSLLRTLFALMTMVLGQPSACLTRCISKLRSRWLARKLICQSNGEEGSAPRLLTTERGTRQRVEVEASRAFVEVGLVAHWRTGPVAAPQTSPRPEVVLAGAGVGREGARGGDGLEEEQEGAIVAARHGILCVCFGLDVFLVIIIRKWEYPICVRNWCVFDVGFFFFTIFFLLGGGGGGV